MNDVIDRFAMSSAIRELEGRTHWALSRIGEFVNAGRAARWLAGDAVDDLTPAECFLVPAAGNDPMRLLATRLGLSELEVDVLWLLACVEIEPKLARASQLLMSPGMSVLNAQVLERLITRSAGFDIDVFDRLSQFGLIETSFDSRVPHYQRPVRACDQVIELARGRVSLDRELTVFATLSTSAEIGADSASATSPIPAELSRGLCGTQRVLVVAKGMTGSGRATLLRNAVSAAGRAVISVRAAELSTDATTLTRQLRSIVRECKFHDAWPLLLDVDGLTERFLIVDRELLRAFPGPVLATTSEPLTWNVARTLVTVEVGLGDLETRRALWAKALPSASSGVTSACADRYRIPPGLLMRTATAASALSEAGGLVTTENVHDALRVQLERRLLGLAERVETRQTWDDLVLPVDQFDLLMELVARVRHRHQVLQTWGFADKVGKGLGLSTLLSGPPGTGKTMIAGLIARELGLDLYQVDLSKIVSKYIGETEKQLAALFEAAESGHAILLFDEADSLFGKRTEVKSSNDRYANLEVNYLLQRMEAFSGISLLTTNHETAIDKAFQRRLAFHIRVPMPDEQQRSLMWTTMIPRRAPRADDLDVRALATEFAMSGGYIKNAVLRAAYLAADEGLPIANAHLWRAARSEYEAMGKVAYHST